MDVTTLSIAQRFTKDYVQEQIKKLPQSGANDYTKLVNKPKINGVELDGDKTLEALGIPTGGGFGLGILDNYDVELITEVYNIDQTDIPKKIEVTLKDNGTPFEYDGLIVWSDVKDAVSYTCIYFNGYRTMFGMSHGDARGMNLFITDGTTMFIQNAYQYPKFAYKQSREDTGGNVAPHASITDVPEKITSFAFGSQSSISSIKFYKAWGLKRK